MEMMGALYFQRASNQFAKQSRNRIGELILDIISECTKVEMQDACTFNMRKLVAKLLEAEFNVAINGFVEQLVAKGSYKSEQLTADVSKITEVIKQIPAEILR